MLLYSALDRQSNSDPVHSDMNNNTLIQPTGDKNNGDRNTAIARRGLLEGPCSML